MIKGMSTFVAMIRSKEWKIHGLEYHAAHTEQRPGVLQVTRATIANS